MSVVENYCKLLDDVAETALKCGRNPSEITLLPVTKFQPWDALRPLYDYGCRQFAESRIQEAVGKVEGAPQDISWHLIGTLQKNKVKKAVALFSLIHSVDTPELAQKISECAQEAGKTVRILLQVNTSGEASKHGLSEDEWSAVLSAIWRLPALQVEGLMTMAPLAAGDVAAGRCFGRLREFRDRIRAETADPRFIHLSMGMSGDYRIAIAEGATLLRVGSQIFSVGNHLA